MQSTIKLILLMVSVVLSGCTTLHPSSEWLQNGKSQVDVNFDLANCREAIKTQNPYAANQMAVGFVLGGLVGASIVRSSQDHKEHKMVVKCMELKGYTYMPLRQ
jgi:hypothetical protein